MPATPSDTQIGFVGLGIMGAPMALNLMKAGYKLKVYNRSDRPRVQEVVDAGADRVDTPALAAVGSDVIITIVTDTPDVENVILGEDGVIHSAASGSTVIDMSTIDPEIGKKMAGLLEGKGVNFIDAPVTGGVGGAEAGTLSILVGGNAEIFERTLPVLNVLGGDVSHMGPVGSGHTTKIANQLIGVATLAGMAEAFVLAKKSGLDMQTFFDAVKNGAGRSWALETLGPKILAGDFEPGFMVKHMQKDLRLANQLAEDTGTSLPTSTLIAQLYRSIQADSPEATSQGHQALVQAIEKLSNDQARL